MPENWASGAICEDLPHYTIHVEPSMQQVCVLTVTCWARCACCAQHAQRGTRLLRALGWVPVAGMPNA